LVVAAYFGDFGGYIFIFSGVGTGDPYTNI
jgi:hypothetical protein